MIISKVEVKAEIVVRQVVRQSSGTTRYTCFDRLKVDHFFFGEPELSEPTIKATSKKDEEQLTGGNG
jgi:phosphoribosylaminoimidazole-succinocarboxamide synthase